MRELNITEKLEMPEGVQISAQKNKVTVKGQNGEVQRSFVDPQIQISSEGNQCVFKMPVYTKKEKSRLGTYRAHIKNMIRGVTESHEYVLKICSGHFPMNAEVKDSSFQVKNFLGEKVPRVLALNKDVQVKVEGDKVHVTGINKELVAQTAANIERLTRRNGFDKRVFQDGIYIVNKDGKEIK